MQGLWELQSTLSLPSLPGSFWARVVALDSVLCMDQIVPFDIYAMYLC